jgi:hypothetical protein
LDFFSFANCRERNFLQKIRAIILLQKIGVHVNRGTARDNGSMICCEGNFVTGNFVVRQTIVAALILSISGIAAQSPAPRPKFETFEVVTIKPVDPDAKAGRYIVMQSPHRFSAKN